MGKIVKLKVVAFPGTLRRQAVCSQSWPGSKGFGYRHDARPGMKKIGCLPVVPSGTAATEIHTLRTSSVCSMPEAWQ